MDGRMNETNGQTDEWRNVRMNKIDGGLINEWIDGWMNGWMDG